MTKAICTEDYQECNKCDRQEICALGNLHIGKYIESVEIIK